MGLGIEANFVLLFQETSPLIHLRPIFAYILVLLAGLCICKHQDNHVHSQLVRRCVEVCICVRPLSRYRGEINSVEPEP